MKLNDIDKIFADRQQQFDKMPAEELWNKLDARLQAAESTKTATIRPLWWKYMAAAAVLVLLIPAVWWSVNLQQSGEMAQNSEMAPTAVEESKGEIHLDEADLVSRSDSEKSVGFVETETDTQRLFAKASPTLEKKENVAEGEKSETGQLTERDNRNKEILPSSASKPVKPIPKTPEPGFAITDKDAWTNAGMEDKNIEAAGENDQIAANIPPPAEPFVEGIKPASMPAADAETVDVPVAGYESPQEIYADEIETEDDQLLSRNNAYSRYNLHNNMPEFTNRRLSAPYDTESLQLEEVTTTRQARKKQKADNKESVPAADAYAAPVAKDEQQNYALISDLSEISWLTGNWCNHDATVSLCENWTVTNANSLRGNSFTMVNNKREFDESFEIQKTGNEIYYNITDAEKKSTLAFKLTEQLPNQITFENRQNDYPNRIIYTYNPNGILTTRFEGTQNGQPVSSEIDFFKSD